jgi:vitamin B12 transporter
MRAVPFFVACVCTALAVSTIAAEQTEAAAGTNLPPMTVVARAIAPSWVYGQLDSPGRALAAVPGALVNSQGGYGGQNDLSIRGSSFSGAGLSLGGLPLRSPQTEHFNAELPLPGGLLTPPRVLTGIDQALATDPFLVGSIGFDFAPVGATRRVSAGAGDYGRQWVSVFAQQPLDGVGDGPRVGISAFAGYETADSVDYPDNDLETWNAGGHVQAAGDDSRVDVVGAVQNKNFGARGYYGVSDSLPAEEELEDTLVLAAARHGLDDASYTRVSAAWRQFDDTYSILPDIYFNQTDSSVLSLFADGRAPIGAGISIAWRGGMEDEAVDGLALGDHDRRRGVLMVMPEWRAGPMLLSAGVREEVFSTDGPALLPQAGASIDVCAAARVYASYTETVRQPSFTELNYESPASLGNAGLERQQAHAVEAGLDTRVSDRVSARAAVFYSASDNTVDWILPTADDTRYLATDIGDVDAWGAEAALAGSFGSRVDAQAQYTWTEKDTEADFHASRYVMDYARHLVKLSATWRVAQALRLTGTQVVRWQTDNPVREGDDVGFIGAVAAHVSWPRRPGVVLTLAVDNLWDDSFQPFPGQLVAGRRASAGLTVEW